MSLLADVIGQKKLSASMRFKHRLSIEEYFQLLGRRRQYSTKFLEALNQGRFDVILCPPDALPALRHGSSYYIGGCGISYAGLYTLLGMPVGVVAGTRIRPCEESDRPDTHDVVERAARYVEKDSVGLPVGVQVAARHWREDVVLATMGVLETFFRAQPEFPSLSKIPLWN